MRVLRRGVIGKVSVAWGSFTLGIEGALIGGVVKLAVTVDRVDAGDIGRMCCRVRIRRPIGPVLDLRLHMSVGMLVFYI